MKAASLFLFLKTDLNCSRVLLLKMISEKQKKRPGFVLNALSRVMFPGSKIILFLLFLASGNVSAGTEAIAISYFDNTSRLVAFDPLSKGIPDMLITDLSKIQGITIVERSRLEDLLKEIELNKSKYFDDKTVQKLGKGLGAKSILTGSFILINEDLRIDARLVDVQSGKIVMAENVNCNKEDFFSGYKLLVELISKQLKLSFSNSASLAPKEKKVGLNTVIQYSKAIDYADKGLSSDASDLLASTVKQFPDFGFARNKLEQIKEWMKEMDRKHQLQVAEETAKLMSGIDIKNPQLGQQINQVWALLVSSFSYSKLLAFNKELRSKGIADDFRLYGEMSPITFGEMMGYYESLSWHTLKNYPKLLEIGKQFMEKYPSSLYYSSIKIFMEQSVAELEKREKGKGVIDKELMKTELEVYVDYFNNYRFRNSLELMSQKEYEFFENLYSARVLDFNDDMLKEMVSENKFSIDELFAFRKAAERFKDIALLDKMGARSKIFGDEALRTEEQIISGKKNIEKQMIFLAEAKKKYSSEEEKGMEQLVRNARELDESMDFIFEEQVMRLYLRQSEATKKSAYRQEAWEHLVFSLLAQGKPAEAKTEMLNLQNDPLLNSSDTIRFKKDLYRFRNDFNEKLKLKEEDKSAYLQMIVYEKKAETYGEHSQFAGEAATRMELVNNFSLPADKHELQLYKLLHAYYNIGYFDDSRKTAKILKEKYPSGSYSQAIDGFVKYMPQ